MNVRLLTASEIECRVQRKRLEMVVLAVSYCSTKMQELT